MLLQNGRPQERGNRLDIEIAAYDLLDELCIEYQRLDHPPAMTMEVCSQIDKSLDAKICKNLFLCNRQETDFYLLMIPADKKFKTKDLSAQIGSSRLSFASEQSMMKYLKTTPGSASILGLMFDKERAVRLLIDSEVLECEYLGCHPNINTSSLRIKMSDITSKLLPYLKISYTSVNLPSVE